MDEKGNDSVTIDDEEPATDKPKPVEKEAEKPAPRPSLIGRLAEKKAIVAGINQGRDTQGLDRKQDKAI
jgi:hypothetical protein